MDDNNYSQYSNYSEINICHSASLGKSTSPDAPYTFPAPHPEPEPPPNASIHVTTVPIHEYEHDELMPPGTSFTSTENDTQHIRPDTSHHLWDTHMFPTSDLELHSYTPATILALLALDDNTRFTTPINKQFLALHHFCLQIDGGANRSVTNNRDCLHTYWDITPYRIGGIGDGIICTGKGIFHVICKVGSVISITMFYSVDATQPTQCSPTNSPMIVGGKFPTAPLVKVN